VFITIGAVRYRAPVEVPIVILAAAAIDALARAWSRRRATTEPTGAPA